MLASSPVTCHNVARPSRSSRCPSSRIPGIGLQQKCKYKFCASQACRRTFKPLTICMHISYNGHKVWLWYYSRCFANWQKCHLRYTLKSLSHWLEVSFAYSSSIGNNLQVRWTHLEHRWWSRETDCLWHHPWFSCWDPSITGWSDELILWVLACEAGRWSLVPRSNPLAATSPVRCLPHRSAPQRTEVIDNNVSFHCFWCSTVILVLYYNVVNNLKVLNQRCATKTRYIK